MATDKPRFTITLEEETLNGVLSYKKKNKLATQSKAIQQLVEIGLEDLLNGMVSKPSEGIALERKYNALDAHGKAVVDSVLDLELKRCTGPVKAAGRIIPLFPAAAGPDDLAEGEPFESYETDNDKADFAVRISGDSMEPHFKNGEVVLCQKRIPNDGDIAVMSVNGAIVVKQYISAFGNIYLRSLNRARKDMDIDILESGNYSVVGYGTVICAKIPLVTQ